MRHPDTRVQVTKELFHRALLKLVKTKPIDRITVKELVEEARLNRGTFYLHYQIPRDVLKEIENEFVAENLSFFDHKWTVETNQNVMENVFACMLENQEIARILMGENGDPQFSISLGNLVRGTVLDEWQREHPGVEREQLESLFEFVFYGSTRLILNWIDDNRGCSVQDLARRLDRLGHYCQLALEEF